MAVLSRICRTELMTNHNSLCLLNHPFPQHSALGADSELASGATCARLATRIPDTERTRLADRGQIARKDRMSLRRAAKKSGEEPSSAMNLCPEPAEAPERVRGTLFERSAPQFAFAFVCQSAFGKGT
jgi:hypothetical protein